MWAQLITMKLIGQLQETELPGSGLVRSTVLRDQKDPSRVSFLVVFESEEKARERENDPRRQEGLLAAQATMAEIFDGAPEFVDFTVVHETSG